MTEAMITIEDVPGAIPLKIAHISGQLDESNVDEKIQEVYQAVEKSPKGLSLIFDLGELEYMNSKSIGYLTDLYGKITEGGGHVAIANAKSNILDILQVVGLTQLVKTFTSTDEAKNHIDTQPVAAPAEPQPEAPAQPEQPAEPQPEAPAEPAQPVEPQPEAPAEQPTEPQPEAPAEQPTEPEQPAEQPAEPQPEAPAEPAQPEKPQTEAPAEQPAEPQPEAPAGEKNETFKLS